MTDRQLTKLARRLGRELGLAQEGWELAAVFNPDLTGVAAVVLCEVRPYG